jgi:hypothetical protein
MYADTEETINRIERLVRRGGKVDEFVPLIHELVSVAPSRSAQRMNLTRNYIDQPNIIVRSQRRLMSFAILLSRKRRLDARTEMSNRCSTVPQTSANSASAGKRGSASVSSFAICCRSDSVCSSRAASPRGGFGACTDAPGGSKQRRPPARWSLLLGEITQIYTD